MHTVPGEAGRASLGTGHGALGSECWALGSGLWELDAGHWALAHVYHVGGHLCREDPWVSPKRGAASAEDPGVSSLSGDEREAPWPSWGDTAGLGSTAALMVFEELGPLRTEARSTVAQRPGAGNMSGVWAWGLRWGRDKEDGGGICP